MAMKGTHTSPHPVRLPPDLANLALEHAPSPMAAVQRIGHILRNVNPAFCRLLERPAEQLLGKPFSEILPDENECVAVLDRVFSSGEPEIIADHDPSKPHHSLSSCAIWPVTPKQRPATVIIQVTESDRLHADAMSMNEALLLGSVRQHELTEAADAANTQLQEEISERKRAQDALQQSQALLSHHAGQLQELVTERTTDLTATNQQLEAFVYSIAHDLRAPLRAIQGFSDLLVEEVGATLSDSGKRYAARISKSAQFMDALLCDLLEFSRLSQQSVQLSPVNLGSVIASVLDSLQETIQATNARVDSAGTWPQVLAHQPTLSQVLVNLIANALKFVKPDVPALLRLWPEERAGMVRIWVEDNGVGIEPACQTQIFQLFTRLQGEKYPGTGIGLAIVQKGVERMGGQAGVDSLPDQGSRFWFELRQSLRDS
jgi:signal transduction histidine kinase